jgi:hypothetical protein
VYGPVWAYDNIERKIAAVQQPDGSWIVTVQAVASYAAFADPAPASRGTAAAVSRAG